MKQHSCKNPTMPKGFITGQNLNYIYIDIISLPIIDMLIRLNCFGQRLIFTEGENEDRIIHHINESDFNS